MAREPPPAIRDLAEMLTQLLEMRGEMWCYVSSRVNLEHCTRSIFSTGSVGRFVGAELSVTLLRLNEKPETLLHVTGRCLY